MSVKTEIQRIVANIGKAYAACGDLGAKLPDVQNSAGLEAAIRTIKGGEFSVPLVVSVEPGAVVTAINGEITVSAVVDESGSATLLLPAPGVYKVRAEKGELFSASQAITVSGMEAVLTLAAGVLVYHKTGDPLSDYAQFPSGLTLGNHALIAGGQRSASSFSKNVYAYDEDLVRKALTDLSTGASQMGAARVGGYGLFAGGQYNYTSSSNPTATVYAYNTALTRSLPAAISPARRFLCGVSGSKFAFLAGGFPTNTTGSFSNAVDAYDDELIHTAPEKMTRMRGQPSGAKVGGYVLIAGNHTSVEVYDENQTHLALDVELSSSRYAMGSAEVGGYALFAGGYSNAVDAFDHELTRVTLEPGLSVVRSLPAGCTLEMYALFGGGSTEEAAIDAFDENLTRTIGPSLSQARASLTGAVVGKFAIFAGGYNRTYLNTVDIITVE